MTATRTVVALAGIGTIGFSAIGVSSAAVAAPGVEACGVVTAGAEVTRSGDVCQVDFRTAGDYSWTVPPGLAGLYAVVAGAGGGAFVFPSVGYAGSGGDVVHVDLGTEAAGTVLSLTVGAGGATSDPSPGGNSTITGLLIDAVAAGGASGTADNGFCATASQSVLLALGDGAGGPAPENGAQCADSAVPGLTPASDLDVAGVPAFPIFAGFADTLGAGGRVVFAPATLDAPVNLIGSGRGADVLVSDLGEVVGADTAGGSGRVVVRFIVAADAPVPTPPAIGNNNQLAATGADVTGLLAGAGALGLLGALAFAYGRRRNASRNRQS